MSVGSPGLAEATRWRRLRRRPGDRVAAGLRGRFGALGAAVIVLVCGPPRAGVTAVTDALRDALSGSTSSNPPVCGPGNAPAVVVFVVSAAPAGDPDCLVLDGVLDAVSADRVVGGVQVDAHRAWRDTVVASRSRYPTLSWLGVTAAPQLVNGGSASSSTRCGCGCPSRQRCCRANQSVLNPYHRVARRCAAAPSRHACNSARSSAAGPRNCAAN